MSRPVVFAPRTFGAWLQAKGFAGFKAVPQLHRTVAIRLHRGEMAPNSPMLPLFAKELGEPLQTLQSFATAPPLAQKWVTKIENQLANGTVPRGGKTHPRKGGKQKRHAHGPRGSPLTQLLTTHTGMPVSALGQRLGITPGTMARLCAGQLGANHPLLPSLAKVLKLDLHTLVQYMHGPRLSEGMIRKSRAALGRLAAEAKARAHTTPAKAPGKALVHVPQDATPTAKPTKRAYNKLRGQSLALREAVRWMVAALNAAIMRGETHMPPTPLREMHVVLADYCAAKGIRGNVLVDPDFDTLFDPH